MPNNPTAVCQKVKYSKSHLDFSDQVALLEERGMIIDIPRAQAEHLLSNINYYHLEAYFYFHYDSSVTDDHAFEKGVDFSLVWNEYRFDRKLRELFFHALERIELSFRTKLSYTLSSTYNTSHPLYVMKNRSKTNLTQAKRRFKSAVKESKETFIKHYRDTYREALPPIWVLVEILSFGDLCWFYRNVLVDSDKKAISSQYGINSSDVFQSWIHNLSYVRNICCHHLRLWNRRLTITPQCMSSDKELSKAWNNGPDHGTRKLYNTCLVIDFIWQKICPESPRQFRDDLRTLLSEYGVDSVKLGFPICWEQFDYWR